VPDDSKTKASSPSSDEPDLSAPAAKDAPDDAPEAEDAEAEAEGEPEAPLDPTSPEAILKRVSAFDEEDAAERIARIEEAKLAARRSKDKKAKKKGGLEAAASKRLAKIGAKAQPKRPAITIPDADPLLDRALLFSKWAKKNKALVRNVSVGAFVAAAGVLGYVWYEHHHEAEASVLLAKAVADERGRIGDPDAEEDADRPHDPTPIFKTNEDRQAAALQGYRAVESKYHGTGAAILARLSEGSLLLDKEDPDGALAAFGDVSASPLAKADVEVRGRALEGMGFAYELKADAQSGDAAKGLLDQAAKQYRTLENTDVVGFNELGMYHQARVLQKEGDTAQAIDLLKKLHERLHKPGEEHKFVYLEITADDALRALAPEAVPPKPAGPPGRQGGHGGKPQMDQEQLKRLIEQMQKSGGKPAPGAPPPEAPK
jgi:hypothetical protein